MGDGRITSLSTVLEHNEFLWTEEQEPISQNHFFFLSNKLNFKNLVTHKKSSWNGIYIYTLHKEGDREKRVSGVKVKEEER
jgi:hypothetical protein